VPVVILLIVVRLGGYNWGTDIGERGFLR
jgi:hypothetical protein